MEKVNVTCRIDQKQVAFLDELAQYMDRDRSYLIKQAVLDFIELHRWELAEVEAAEREISEGKGLSDKQFHAEVKTWLK
jgi:predicted transcriptional regulator